MGILKTKPYKGKLKRLNEIFVPSMGKDLKNRIDKFTEFKNGKL